MPAPISESVTGEFVALLETVTDPDALPEVVGANVAPKETDWPTASVSGRVGAATVKPEPVTVIAETVTLDVPVFEMVAVCVAFVPIV
jgi:hypothetical protein